MRKYNGKIIDITATEAKLGNLCSDPLPVHVLSECDTVLYPDGQGKVSAVNLMLNFDLDLSKYVQIKAYQGVAEQTRPIPVPVLILTFPSHN